MGLERQSIKVIMKNKTRKYKLIYTEQYNDSQPPSKDYIILETEDIQWSVDQFMRNRYITDYKIIALNEKE